MSFRTIIGLMDHLSQKGIAISGDLQKRQLINMGYFHGYKGYRFFKNSSRQIPFQSFADINLTVQYDSELKSLFYSKLMFIETAVKNIALNRIMIDSNSESIYEMLHSIVMGYSSFPTGAPEQLKREAQNNKLRLESNIQLSLSKAYSKGNPQVTHYFNRPGGGEVPLWALFEIMTLGDFAHLISCLNWGTRDNISSDLGWQIVSVDTNRELVYRFLYILKDLRNAVAHNAVIFDTRFNKSKPSKAMTACIQQYFKLPMPVYFDTISDYVLLVCYYLVHLKETDKEIKSFLENYESITDNYVAGVDKKVATAVIRPDWRAKISLAKNLL